MEWTTLVSHLLLASFAIAASFALLFVTKSPAIITIVSASVAAGAYMLYARLDLGYWDKFAAVALVVSWVYSVIVSFVFLAIGRFFKWSYFLGNK